MARSRGPFPWPAPVARYRGPLPWPGMDERQRSGEGSIGWGMVKTMPVPPRPLDDAANPTKTGKYAEPLTSLRAGSVDTFVTTNGGMHVMLLTWSYRAERSNERTAAVRPEVTVGEEQAKSLGGFNSQSQPARHRP